MLNIYEVRWKVRKKNWKWTKKEVYYTTLQLILLLSKVHHNQGSHYRYSDSGIRFWPKNFTFRFLNLESGKPKNRTGKCVPDSSGNVKFSRKPDFPSGIVNPGPWPPSPSLINPCLATKQLYPYATPATATPPHVSSRGEQWPQYVCQREGGLKMFVLASGKMGNLGLVRVSSSSWKCSFYWLIRASTRGL